MSSPKPKSTPDYTFIALVGILTIFGLVMLASASSDLARMRFGDSYFYIKHQALYGLSIGVVGFLVGVFLYYDRWRKWATSLLVLSVTALALVFTPLGFAAKGATRWLEIGGMSLQPGELVKLTFLLYLASWISQNKKRAKSVTEGLLPFLFLVGIVMVLILAQPSTTTAVILFGASLIMYFTSGAKVRFLVAIALLAALGFSLLTYTTPYRMERVMTFLNPSADQLDKSYHLNQALIAIGSGGLTGVGYGESTTKLNYLPEPIGDSIFAVIAEELGFIGSSILLLVFAGFVWRGFAIAKDVPDVFGRLLVISFVSVIGLQTLVNIAAISGALPLTGVPLPFISFGGTALAVFLTMSGIIVNVSRYRR